MRSGEAIVISSTDGSKWSVQDRIGATPSQLSKVIWNGMQIITVGQERIVSVPRSVAEVRAPKLVALRLTICPLSIRSEPLPQYAKRCRSIVGR